MTSDAMAPVERFGPFELLGPLGRGGMAEVFRARLAEGGGLDGLPEVFALKRMLPEVMVDPDAREAFLTEADVAPLLRHPNLVRVYHSGHLDGRGFLAMELVDGLDLEQVITARPGKPLPPPVACKLIREVLRGLEYLHRATGRAGTPLGLIHRDVTPSNVFLSRDGRVKLADLGIAIIVGLESQRAGGRVRGKLHYLSPEQVVAGELGPETDVYAAGTVLFELLTGRRVFEGPDEQAVMLAIRDGKKPRLRTVAPELPSDLERVVTRALDHRLRRRFPTAAAFRDALDAVCYAHGWEMFDEELVSGVEGFLGL